MSSSITIKNQIIITHAKLNIDTKGISLLVSMLNCREDLEIYKDAKPPVHESVKRGICPKNAGCVITSKVEPKWRSFSTPFVKYSPH